MLATPKKVLVFAAHPDDEIIGVGGTVSRLHEEGSSAKVVIFSKGGGGLADKDTAPELLKEERAHETEEVAKLLGFEHKILGMREILDRREATRLMLKEIRSFKPDMVFTHSPLNKHHLHRAISECSTEACWHTATRAYSDIGEPWRVGVVYFYEVFDLFTSSDLIVDITRTYKRKVDAMQLYKSQVEVFPGILDYLKALARVRGFLAEGEYGEAFEQSNATPIYV